MQWREPPDRENRSFSKIVNFGRYRDAGSGYMALSDRVGPCVLIVHGDGSAPWLRPTADRLNKLGFTLLAPHVPRATGDVRGPAAADILIAAADFLIDNWHPELGVIVYRSPDERVRPLLTGGKLAAVVAYDGLPDVEPDCPLQLHLPAVPYPGDIANLRPDTEAHLYSGTDKGFAEPNSTSFHAASAELAEERLVDFFSYYLS
ncbi:MAG: dienelactone hydrolase family protein [Actinomycetota bacterium]|nr:dienelactone hydrolase family protein [Actinomycetota bacterium]